MNIKPKSRCKSCKKLVWNMKKHKCNKREDDVTNIGHTVEVSYMLKAIDNARKEERNETLDEVNKLIDGEIKNEEEAHKNKAKRYWYYYQELKLLKKKLKSFVQELRTK